MADYQFCYPRAVSFRTNSQPAKYRTIAFVGAGALATSMARSLAMHGYQIREFVLRTADKKIKPTAALRTLAGGLNARLSTFDDCNLDADIVWMAVPDDVIEDCSKHLAKGRKLSGKVALHSSGALSSEALAAMKKAGAATASLHPMMSFSTANRNPELKGVWFSAEGEPTAVRVAQQIVKSVDGNVLSLKAGQKALYHAFGAMIAPLMVSHLEAAEQMGRRVGLTPKTARAVMKPILEKVVAGFLVGGAQQAFSGPFLRGDVKTVERHLQALRKSDEDVVYRALAKYAIEHIKVENREKLRKLLAKP
jgi:predicted short-subunit dehydrogenase-like oxidoreductase (DUF2520 family)